MKINEMADLLRLAGSKKASEQSIKKMISMGAPQNEDGTIDIVKFTAWMLGMKNGRLQTNLN